MLKNNNQAITRKISKRFMHKNKMRNRITILAIILMTFMFTTVFSIGFSMAKNMNTMLIRQAGTTAEISLANPAPEQIDEIKKCSALSAAGVTIPVCKAKSEEDQDLNFKLIYHDKENFNGNIKPALSSLKGNYPDEKNEIMLSVSGLNAIGIKSPEIGMDIPLMLKNEEQIFKLSGYFVDYGFRTNNYDAFVSEKFSDGLGLTAEQDGLISISSKSFLQNILYDQLYESVKLNQGQEFECTFDNNENNGIVIAAAVLFICLIIIISGYLLIYNIMYISVNHDIRFYGLLKTIGTTSKQIRSIVKYQSLSLSVIGIPIGILIGTIVSFKAIPYSISMFGGDFYSAMPTDISFNPLIYMGTILFALLTILISCRKPAKFAGSISPIEALKYNGQNNCKIKSRKATNGGRIYKMAYRNIFREKKRTVLVFASLLMGVIALLSTQTFLNSLDLKNYADYYLPNDFVIYTDCSSEEDFEVNSVSSGYYDLVACNRDIVFYDNSGVTLSGANFVTIFKGDENYLNSFFADGYKPVYPDFEYQPVTQPTTEPTSSSSSGDNTEQIKTSKNILDNVKNLVKAIGSLPSTIYDAVSSALSGLVDKISSIFDLISDFFSSFFTNLFNKLKELLVFLFIPDEDNAFTEIKNVINEKFGFISQFTDLASKLVNLNFSSDVPAFEFTIYGKKYSIIDWSLYQPYRKYIHSIIIVISYYHFIQRTIKRIPSIIGGITSD